MVVKTDADLYITLGLNTSALEEGLNSFLGSATRAAEKAASTLAPALERIPVDSIQRGLDRVGETLQEFAQRLGFAGDDLTQLQSAFSTAGVGASDFQAMLEAAAQQAQRTGQTTIQALEEISARFANLTEQGARDLGASLGLPPTVVASFRAGQGALDNYSTALSRASSRQSSLTLTANRMGNVLNRVAGAISSFVAPLLGALSIGSLATSFFKAAKEIDEASRSFRISSDTLQLWSGAAREAGVGASDFDKVLQNVSQNAVKYGTTTEKELERARQMYRRMSYGQAQRIGAREGYSPEAINFLRLSNKEFQRQIDLQKKLGVIDKRAIESARRLRFAKDALREAYNKLSAQIMSKLSPAFELIITKLNAFVGFLRENKDFTTAAIIGIAAAITAFLLPALTELAGAVLANPITWIFLAIAASVALVAALVDDFFTFLDGGDGLFDWTGIVESFKEIEKALKPLVDWFKKTWPDAASYSKKILKSLIEVWVANFQSLINSVSRIIGNVAKVIEKVSSFVSALFSGDKEKIISSAVDLFSTIVDVTVDNISAIFDFFADALTNFWGLIKKGFPDFAGWAEDVAGSIVNTLVGAFETVIAAAKKLVAWLPDSVKAKVGLSDTPPDTRPTAQIIPFKPRDALAYADMTAPVTGAMAEAFFPGGGFGANQMVRPIEVDRSRTTSVKVDQNITNNITAPDPKAAGDAVATSLSRTNDDASRRFANASNTGTL